LKAEVNRLQRSVTTQLNEWRNDRWSNTLESLDPEDQSLWKMTRWVMRIPTPSPLLITPGGLALSDSEKAEALAESLEAQFQPVNDPSVPAVIEVVNEAMRAHSFAPASEPKLTNPTEVQDAIRGLKVGKAPGPDGIPNRALKHLPLSIVSLLVVLFNAILQTQYFPVTSKPARVFSILKPGKDPALPSSYRPISLLDTIGKLFEKMLLSRILHEVSGRGLLCDEQFGFRPKHSTALQLVRLVERVSRNFGEKRLTGAVFLDVAKAFDTVWVAGLLYKFTNLHFPSYLVKVTSSYLNGRTFEASFQTAISTIRRMLAGVAQGGIISPVLFSLYVNDMPSPSRHVSLASAPLKDLETYHSDLERWFSEWRIVIDVSKSSAMLFAKTGRRIQNPRTVQLFVEPIQWVDVARYHGVTLDKRLNWSKHIDQVRKKATQIGNSWISPEQENQSFHQEWWSAV
jgi:hypothetical protein